MPCFWVPVVPYPKTGWITHLFAIPRNSMSCWFSCNFKYLWRTDQAKTVLVASIGAAVCASSQRWVRIFFVHSQGVVRFGHSTVERFHCDHRRWGEYAHCGSIQRRSRPECRHFWDPPAPGRVRVCRIPPGPPGEGDELGADLSDLTLFYREPASGPGALRCASSQRRTSSCHCLELVGLSTQWFSSG
jgi:hypothetical protein